MLAVKLNGPPAPVCYPNGLRATPTGFASRPVDFISGPHFFPLPTADSHPLPAQAGVDHGGHRFGARERGWGARASGAFE